MENSIITFYKKNQRQIIAIVSVLAFHIIIAFIPFYQIFQKSEKRDPGIFKMVDIKEYDPNTDPNKIEVAKQEQVAESMIETNKEIKELDTDYLPQHLISEMPVIPVNILNSKKVYPPLANKQGIEGVVFLELFIDQNGNIKKVNILKDPGYGFGEAAIKAFQGVKCAPARSNGIPVAVRIRYPLRFTLK